MSFIAYLQKLGADKLPNLQSSQKTLLFTSNALQATALLNSVQNDLGYELYQNYLDKKAWADIPPSELEIMTYKKWCKSKKQKGIFVEKSSPEVNKEFSVFLYDDNTWFPKELASRLSLETAIETAKNIAIDKHIPYILDWSPTTITSSLKLSNETYFDSTPSEAVMPEDRNFTNPLSEDKLKRTNPKRFDRNRDWYNDPMTDSVINFQNRADEVVARLEEVDWEINKYIEAGLSKTASINNNTFINKIKERYELAEKLAWKTKPKSTMSPHGLIYQILSLFFQKPEGNWVRRKEIEEVAGDYHYFQYLLNQKYVERIERGLYRVTDRGREVYNDVRFGLDSEASLKLDASENEQVIITYEGFPQDVKEFVEDYFKDIIEKYPDLKEHLKSVKIIKAERPEHYPASTGAEYDTGDNSISAYIDIEKIFGELRQGLVHELVHAVQVFLDGREEDIPRLPKELDDKYYSGDLQFYWKNPLEEHAYSVEKEFKKRYVSASLKLDWADIKQEFKVDDEILINDPEGSLVIRLTASTGFSNEFYADIIKETAHPKYQYRDGYLFDADNLDEKGITYELIRSSLKLDWNLNISQETLGLFDIGDPIYDQLTHSYGNVINITLLSEIRDMDRSVKEMRRRRLRRGEDPNKDPLVLVLELYESEFPARTFDPPKKVLRSLRGGVQKLKKLPRRFHWNTNVGLDIEEMELWLRGEYYDEFIIKGYGDLVALDRASDLVNDLTDDEIAERYLKAWGRYLLKKSSLKLGSSYDEYTERNRILFEDRYNNYGDDGGRLFWSSSFGQRKRFKALLDFSQQPEQFLKQASVLDVGCGYGDFISYVKEKFDIDNFNYAGTELVQQMIDIATQKHPNFKFELKDIVKQPYPDNSFDLIIGSGLFAFNHPQWSDFVSQLVTSMYKASKGVVAVNFLQNAETNDSFKYTTPEEVYTILSKITKDLRIEKDYLPDDFTVYLYKNLDSLKLNWATIPEFKVGDKVIDSAGDVFRISFIDGNGYIALESTFRSGVAKGEGATWLSPKDIIEFEIRKINED